MTGQLQPRLMLRKAGRWASAVSYRSAHQRCELEAQEWYHFTPPSKHPVRMCLGPL